MTVAPSERSPAPVLDLLGVPLTAHTRESAADRVVGLALRHRAARRGNAAPQSAGMPARAPQQADRDQEEDWPEGRDRGRDGGLGHRAARGAVAAQGELAGEPGRPGSDVHLCNAHTLALTDRDPALRATLARAALNLPDGQPVVWANRLLYRRTLQPSARVYGPDLFLDVFAVGQRYGLRHYLLGSTPEVLNALRHELRRRFPLATIAGSESPPFRPLTEREAAEQRRTILASGAEIVWVGLGTPKQDWRAAELAAGLPVVAAAVGAAFDFVAGHKRQAPVWMRICGLEWAFRLGCEPRRLWRRYLFGNARFVGAVARQALRTGARRRTGLPLGEAAPYARQEGEARFARSP